MPKMKLLKYLTLSQTREVLEKMGKEEELNNIQAITLEYARKFSKGDSKKMDKALAKLTTEYGLQGEIAVQVLNIMPTTIDELRTILSPLTRTFSTEELEKIIKLLDDYRLKTSL